MALGEGTFRARAASLLHPFTSAKTIDYDERRSNGGTTLNEKGAEAAVENRPHHHTSGPNAVAHDRVAQRDVRAVPGQ